MKSPLPLLLWFVPLPVFAAVNVSMKGLVDLVIYLLVLAGVTWLLLFIVGKWAPPEPFAKFIPAFIYTVAALILIALLLSFVGIQVVNFR